MVEKTINFIVDYLLYFLYNMKYNDNYWIFSLETKKKGIIKR